MLSQTCPVCGGRGIIIKEGPAASICPCSKTVRIKNLANSSHINGNLREKSFTSFSLEYYSRTYKDSYSERTHYDSAARAIEACKSFVRDCLKGKSPRGLYIFGQVGSGKTHLACGIANELIKGGVEVLFVVVPDYLDEIKHSWDQGSDYSEKEILDSAREVEVLIMDDLGAHNYSEWTKGKIYTILNYRVNNGLPTVITSNLEYHETEDYLDYRISSRLIELCRPILLQVNKSEDIRLQKIIRSSQKQKARE